MIFKPMRNFLWWFMVLPVLIVAFAGCREPEAAQSPENGSDEPETPVERSVTPEPPRPTPTPQPPATPTPVVIYLVATPTPTPGTPVPAEHAATPEADKDGNGQEQAEPTPTPGPPPTPTPKYRPFERPESTGYNGFSFSADPQISGNILTFSAVIDGQGHTPTQVQIYHALRVDDINSGRCTTDRPVALVSPGPGSGSTPIQWEYCGALGVEPTIYVDDVPWVSPGAWEYTERYRARLNVPYTYDWNFRVNLNDARVEPLLYESGVGFIVVMFSGDDLLAKVWVDG